VNVGVVKQTYVKGCFTEWTSLIELPATKSYIGSYEKYPFTKNVWVQQLCFYIKAISKWNNGTGNSTWKQMAKF